MIPFFQTIRHSRYSGDFLLAGLMLLFLAGCGSVLTSTSSTSSTGPVSHNPEYYALTQPERHLWESVKDWQGVSYRYGGTSRRGIDCSGFVSTVYRNTYGIDLPRSTRDQVRIGYAVQPEKLRSGDLVFFRQPGKFRHVGLYLGNGLFIHASTSRGVVVSALEENYWRRSYWTARRVLR